MTIAVSSLLPASYGPVLLVVLIQVLHCTFETFPISSVRRRVFTKAFYEKHFAGVHPAPAPNGYPDTVRQLPLRAADEPPCMRRELMSVVVHALLLLLLCCAVCVQGYGRYADKLSHADWLDLCNAQRVHQNYLEQMPALLCCDVSHSPHQHSSILHSPHRSPYSTHSCPTSVLCPLFSSSPA